jgi:hypothetical protein
MATRGRAGRSDKTVMGASRTGSYEVTATRPDVRTDATGHGRQISAKTARRRSPTRVRPRPMTPKTSSLSPVGPPIRRHRAWSCGFLRPRRDTEKFSLKARWRQQLELAGGASSGRSASTVYGGHEHNLRQTVIALAAGRTLEQHENPGEATVHVLHAAGSAWPAGRTPGRVPRRLVDRPGLPAQSRGPGGLSSPVDRGHGPIAQQLVAGESLSLPASQESSHPRTET